MNHGACPPREVLQAFAMGDLDETELDDVALHLESCLACESDIAQFDGKADTVLLDLRRRRGGTSGKATRPGETATYSPPSAPDSATGPPEQLDDFQIVREIGRGGMGVV